MRIKISQAIVEADAGDFASDEQVAAKMKKWGPLQVRWLRRALEKMDAAYDHLAAVTPRCARKDNILSLREV